MLSLYIDESDCDLLTGSGREPAICELRCENCGDGLRFHQQQCATCGERNPRYTIPRFEGKAILGSTPSEVEVSFWPR